MANQWIADRVQRIVDIRRRIRGSPPVCIFVDSLRLSNYISESIFSGAGIVKTLDSNAVGVALAQYLVDKATSAGNPLYLS